MSASCVRVNSSDYWLNCLCVIGLCGSARKQEQRKRENEKESRDGCTVWPSSYNSHNSSCNKNRKRKSTKESTKEKQTGTICYSQNDQLCVIPY